MISTLPNSTGEIILCGIYCIAPCFFTTEWDEVQHNCMQDDGLDLLVIQELLNLSSSFLAFCHRLFYLCIFFFPSHHIFPFLFKGRKQSREFYIPFRLLLHVFCDQVITILINSSVIATEREKPRHLDLSQFFLSQKHLVKSALEEYVNFKLVFN